MGKEIFDHSITLKEMSLARLDMVNGIINDYIEKGYNLTLRQLYYRLVTMKEISNKVTEYNRLGSLLTKGRLSGLVDWTAIEDRVRRPRIPYAVSDPKEAIENEHDVYRLDRMEGQSEYIEVWTEKDALSGILYPVTSKYHINLMVNRGYTSITAIYEGFERMYYYLRIGIPVRIIYMGDHDPSGIDMIRDIEDRLLTMMSGARVMRDFERVLNKYITTEEYEEDMELLLEDKRFLIRIGRNQGNYDATKAYMRRYLTVESIALTLGQIEQYDLPPDPAKIKDPRAKGYMNKYGGVSWELDALPPDILTAILDEAITDVVDLDLIEEIKKQEKMDKVVLTKIIEKL
ncbi:hypothetical protein LCGC14_0245500 [marine sediment metagenome]|uniref:Uncharacterized protein n=1 Tax=marine sediment metagenome TaxID=412755 RepID=A0A0F9UAH5_9ZZZZ